MRYMGWMTEKASYHHGALRKALLDAAVRHLEREGSEDLSLRRLAEEIGVTSGAPYRHFSSKDELLAAVAALGFHNLAEIMRQRAKTSAEPKQRLLLTGVAYAGYAARNPHMFRLMFGPWPPVKSEELERLGAEAFDVLLQRVRDCQAAGLIAEGDPRQPAMLAWGVVHGISSLFLNDRLNRITDDKDAEAVAAVAVRAAWDGLAAMGRPI